MNKNEFQTLIEKYQQEYEMPALIVNLFNAAEIQLQAVTGVRKWGEDTAVTLHDHFHIGSCAKAMTTTLIASLIEDNYLQWDTTISAAFPDNKNIHPQLLDVTIEQLLRHMAGLQPYEEEEELVGLPDMSAEPMSQRQQFTAHVLSQPPVIEPNTEFKYSNAGYCVATAMFENIIGQSWEFLMQERIFIPLHLDAGFGWPARSDPEQPWGHMVLDEKIVPHDPNDEYQLPPFIAPAGDVYVNFNEYPKWLQANLRGLNGEESIVKPNAFQFLHTKKGEVAGLGWGIQDFMGQQVSVHTGSADTFFVIDLIAPDADFGITMGTNIFCEKVEKGCISLLKELVSQQLLVAST